MDILQKYHQRAWTHPGTPQRFNLSESGSIFIVFLYRPALDAEAMIVSSPPFVLLLVIALLCVCPLATLNFVDCVRPGFAHCRQ